MKITVVGDNGQAYPLELDGEMDLETVQIILEGETGVAATEQALWLKGVWLSDGSKTLLGHGVADNDMLWLRRKGQGPPPTLGRIQVPQRRVATPLEEAQAMIREVKSDPYQLSIYKQNIPQLADAILAEDAQKVADILKKLKDEKEATERERNELYRRLAENPFDVDAQRKIEDMIRQENVSQNMMQAMEHNPEAFGSVHMLYIECEVNKTPVKAFVDSGAQMTIMSPSCAERCGIMRLVDTRWAGMAKGVGQAKIVGRVHMVDVKIGTDFLPCSFSILENQDVDMLLGLDMLKRHQCCIDLKRSVLHIGTTGAETPFLAEKDLPERARLNRSHEDEARDDQAATEGASGQGSVSLNEEDITNLMGFGFPRERVVEALTAAGGNVDLAASILMGTN
eukprot:comp20635_c0_seq1/m.26710 comp20635_c0_seq1/g.26710  ORF comp20635_c0_seq1/g.26710 comp20635_c0_seq1/m.26710 type:complete len:397 (-) comp20635_c0_seq1:204-1394(-)